MNPLLSALSLLLTAVNPAAKAQSPEFAEIHREFGQATAIRPEEISTLLEQVWYCSLATPDHSREWRAPRPWYQFSNYDGSGRLLRNTGLSQVPLFVDLQKHQSFAGSPDLREVEYLRALRSASGGISALISEVTASVAAPTVASSLPPSLAHPLRRVTSYFYCRKEHSRSSSGILDSLALVSRFGLQGLLDRTAAMPHGDCVYGHRISRESQQIAFRRRSGRKMFQSITSEHHDYSLSIPKTGTSVRVENGAGSRTIESELATAEDRLNESYTLNHDDASYVHELLKGIYDDHLLAAGINETEARLGILLLKNIVSGHCGD